MTVVGQPLLNSSPIGLRAIADRPPGPVRITAYGARRLNPAGFFFGKIVGSIAVSEKNAAGSKCMPGGALVTSWPLKSPASDQEQCLLPSFEETAPLLWEEIVGAATLSRFVSNDPPRERCI
jgi:hypothetical protein